MYKEHFVSSTLSRKQTENILLLFHQSQDKLGDARNTIRIIDYLGEKLVVKSFKKPHLINKIAYKYFRKSKARRSYENAMYLQKNNLGTPEPKAFLEYYDITGLKNSYYISAFYEHDYTYRELINDASIENKKELLIAFTDFMYTLHEHKVYFLDHSPGNTLIKDGATISFALVDLNRMKFYDIPYESRLKNFERLSPKKWMYEIMGAHYAHLSGESKISTIKSMWQYASDFQTAYHRKRNFKKKLKSWFK